MITKLILRILVTIMKHSRMIMKVQHNRHVSIGDLLTDRWETAQFYGFGDGTSVYNNVLIIGDVTVGKNCWIGPNVILDGSGGLILGDGCTVSAGAHIYSHNNVEKTISNNIATFVSKPTVVGDHVYVGPNAIISAGVNVGHRSVIGALTFVDKDIAPDTKYHSNVS